MSLRPYVGLGVALTAQFQTYDETGVFLENQSAQSLNIEPTLGIGYVFGNGVMPHAFIRGSFMLVTPSSFDSFSGFAPRGFEDTDPVIVVGAGIAAFGSTLGFKLNVVSSRLSSSIRLDDAVVVGSGGALGVELQLVASFGGT